MSNTTDDFRGQGANAGNGIVLADSFGSNNGTDLIIGSDNSLTSVQQAFVVDALVTLTSLNAGATILPPIPGRTYKIEGYFELFNGTFTGATDIRLQDTNLTPVVVNTVLIAGATAGAKVSSESVIANVTDGAGFMAPLTIGKGVQLVKTGSAATGGTSIKVRLLYTIT